MKSSRLLSTALGGLMLAGALGGTVTAARAGSGSTLAAAATAIIGSLFVDNATHREYYVRENRRYYVSDDTANYYRSHRGHMMSHPQRVQYGNVDRRNDDHRNMGRDDRDANHDRH